MPRTRIKLEAKNVRFIFRDDAGLAGLDFLGINRRDIKQVWGVRGDGYFEVLFFPTADTRHSAIQLRSVAAPGTENDMLLVDEMLDEAGSPVPPTQWDSNPKLASLFLDWML